MKKSKNQLLYIGIIIVAIEILSIGSMMFFITPYLKNEPSAFTDLREFLGNDAAVDNIGDELPPDVLSRDVLEYNIANTKGNIYEINSIFTTYDRETGEKLYENVNTYFVDRMTRKHSNDDRYYFKFPTNVKKQDYDLLDPAMETPARFIFEGVRYFRDLEVYQYTCSSTGADFSKAWEEFAPVKIYADQSCEVLVEPVTGKMVHTHLVWDMYAIQDGKHISIEKGHTHTTEFTEIILYQIAKKTKELYYFYDYVIPAFIIILSIAAFLISMYNRNLKEKERIIREQLEEVKTINASRIKMLEEQSKYEKFSIIGELSARFSHDVRNPLSIIKMSIELIENEHNEKFNDETRNRIKRIKKAVDRIAHQVENVLSFVKSTNPKLETVSLKTIIEQSLESLKIPNGIKVTVPKSDVTVTVDPLQIEIVFANLIMNAIQALGESGEIEIKISDNSENTEIQVIDSGPGIPEDKLSEIFVPLFTTKQTGTGLGLASCMTIIKNHGGTITVKNNPTTFTITLPKITENSQHTNKD